jgi:TPR repeat protein
MSAGEKQAALIRAGAKSLVARGRADLQVKEEAEEWLQKGLGFYWQRRYKDAFACFERGIQLNPNRPELQLMLGYLYIHGQGVPLNIAQAAMWFRRAADQGQADAQMMLMRMSDENRDDYRNQSSPTKAQSEQSVPPTSVSDWRSERLSKDQREASIRELEQTIPDLQFPVSDEISGEDLPSRS